MEREFEKAIREKVNKLEETPIAWRKEYAWTQVNVQASPSINKRIFYYAAAAALIAILVTIASINELKTQRALSKRLTGLEEAIEKVSVVTKPDASPFYETEKIIECPEPVPNSFSQNRFDKVTSLAKDFKQKNHFSNQGLLKDSTIDIEEPKLAASIATEEKEEQKPRVVHAIFSVESAPTIVSFPKQKKIRFRMFRQEDETIPSVLTPEPLNLSARINKK